MILNFEVENFASIRDRQILSFEANKDVHLEKDFIIKIGNKRILKTGIIYGANASGKTTIIKALSFFVSLVMLEHPLKDIRLSFQPFLFDKESRHRNSFMSLEFIDSKDSYYIYEFTFNKNAIISEKLYKKAPRLSLVFERQTDEERQIISIKLGDKYKKSLDEYTLNALKTFTLPNMSVISASRQINIDFDILRDVYYYFAHSYIPFGLDTDYSSSYSSINMFASNLIKEGNIDKELVVEMMREADFNISAISFVEKFLDVSSETDSAVDDIKDDEIKGIVKNLQKAVKNIVHTIKLDFQQIEFKHNVGENNYSLDFEQESAGTKKYYAYAVLLALMKSKSTVLIIDELESSLHPNLYMHFYLSFLKHSKHSQLIISTHNREILGDRDLFRYDAIWFTEKDKNSSTTLYSLADFDKEEIDGMSSVLKAYQNGRLGATPNIL